MRILMVILALLLGSGLLFKATVGGRAWDGPETAHFDGEHFRMPGGVTVGDKSFLDLLRWQTSRAPAVWPETVAVVPAKPAARVEGTDIVVTMVGHATVLVQTRGLNILTDPIWSERASPVSFAGPKRVTAPGIRFEDLPKVDVVLVSHGHWDHLDVPTLKRLWERDGATIIVPPGHGKTLRPHGIAAIEADWGKSIRVADGAMVVPEMVQHWTSRWGVDRNRALWAGYTVILPEGNVYFAGDTGYGDGDFYRTVRRHGPVRLALLPVGAYEPRWFMAEQHMNPAEAVMAMQDLGAQQAVGLHWGTFPLTDEGWDAPRKDLAVALRKAEIAAEQFPALLAGERMAM